MLGMMKLKSKIKDKIPDIFLKRRKMWQESRLMYRDSRESYVYASKKKRNREKHKIVLVFIIYMPEVWNSLKSVCDFAMADPQFEVYILAQPRISVLGHSITVRENEAMDFLGKKYKNVVEAYDFKEDKWFDIEVLSPDYVFYTRPYNIEYYDLYKPCKVREYAKVCMIPYGYDVVNNCITDGVYNIDFLRYVSLLFCSSYSVMERNRKKFLKEYSKGYIKIVYLGFPRFDLLYDHQTICEKDRNFTTVLWTPRWTSEGTKNNMNSSFLNYKGKFLEFMRRNPEFELIIRPHPLMFANYIQKGIMKEEEVKSFKEECNKTGNIIFDEEKDYLPSLLKADIFVSDFSSLLAEYFVTGKPVVYCDVSDEFSAECKEMDQYFYHATSWDEIEKAIFELKRKKTGYRDVVEKLDIFPKDIGKIGKMILEYIVYDYGKDVDCS